MDRRNFIRGTATAASVAALHARAYAAPQAKARRVGLIGCGWYGKCDLLQLMNVQPVEVVSLCDVDSRMLDEAADLFASRQVSKNRPRTYADYKQLLAQQDLDIVLIATPDHWHALTMIAAVEAGADVYVQKPTGVDVLESKAMLDAARRTGRVVQVGTQRRSTPHLIEAKQKIVDAGLLGDIAHAEVCCYYHKDKYPTDVSDVKDWRLERHVASAIRGHMQDFLDAIDNRSRPIADIEQGHLSSASCFLANHSLRLGRSLEFDPEAHAIVGDPEATASLKREYRQPYIHPAQA